MLPLPSIGELARRLPWCMLGLALFGLGISLIIRADLGLAPWDVFHQGVSDHIGMSIGTVIVIAGIAILALWIPLRQRIGVGTILNAVEIGVVVALVVDHLPRTERVAGRAGYLAVAMILLAVGSGMYLGADLGAGPRDGLMVGLNERFGWSISRSRTTIELSVLATGIALGGSIGIGTVVFAVGIGPLVQLALPRFRLAPSGEQPATA